MGSTNLLQYLNSIFHYTTYGNGAEMLIAFHGFSESGRSFAPLKSVLSARYTMYAFDLPFHGATQWKENRPFTTADLESLIIQFTQHQGFEKFAVLGFSMGGKCALHLAQVMPEKISALWLLASDGIKTNKIYNVAVYPTWGRSLFKTTIQHPGWLFGLVNMANKLNLLSPWLKKFTYNHMETKEKRERLYHTWISMAAFNPDIPLVKNQIIKNNIPVLLFFGKRDEVIPVTVGAYFAEGLPNCKFTQLERGHYFIDEKINPALSEALQWLN